MSEWGEISLGEGCEILDSLRVPLNADERDGIKGDVPYYGANGLQGYINKAIFDEPLILLAEDGGYFDEYETRPIAYRISGPSWVNNHAHVLRVKKEGELDQDFTFYCLQHKNITPFIKGGTRAKLNQSELREIVVPKPPPNIQRRIATILTTLDEVIEATEKLVEKHQQIKAGLMHDLFTRGLWTRPELARGDHKGLPCEATAQEGQIRPTPEEAPGLYQNSPLGLIPKAWEAASLLSISNSMTNGFVGTATPYYSEDENAVQYLYGNNVRADKLELPSSMRVTRRFHELQRKSQLQPGDMLTVQSGHIGTSAIVPESLGEANCHALIITKFKTSRVVPDFVSYYCNSPGGYRRLGSIFVGSTILHINVKEFKNFAIPLPQDLSEQESICDRLVAINERINTENTHLAKLRQQKQGLMHDLLTGRVRVDGEDLAADS